MRITGTAQSEAMRKTVTDYVVGCLIYEPEEDDTGLHFLKTVEPHYTDTIQDYIDPLGDGDKVKKADIRPDDRGAIQGDFLCLEQYLKGDDGKYFYTGHAAIVYVTHKLTHEAHPQGLQKGHCSLSLDVCQVIDLNTRFMTGAAGTYEIAHDQH